VDEESGEGAEELLAKTESRNRLRQADEKVQKIPMA
jgi:hypothetical protein